MLKKMLGRIKEVYVLSFKKLIIYIKLYIVLTVIVRREKILYTTKTRWGI
ncbi:hypothetical protein MTLP_13340 [Candidatus Methanoliparum sp. LAM-1]|nr:hypothetical protein MTLP_13340 [Candidatus Methanoliparum sp. LAM-1]